MGHTPTSDEVMTSTALVEGLDLPTLDAYLRREVPGLVTGPLTAAPLAGGHSNLTYTVSDGTSTWVLRRPPLGDWAPAAHDMARECAAMRGLAGTPVPVPGVVHLCADPDVLGAPFYLSEFVAGTVYRTREDTAGFTAERARAISFELIDVLADLHSVVPAEVGLDRFGRPEGFLERQVTRWTGQAERLLKDEPGTEGLIDRLRREMPTTLAARIVHGDYRLDNVMIADDDRLVAVLDWEMATLGDPLTDLGLLWCYWKGVENPGGDTMRKGIDPALGFPGIQELVDRYATRTGADIDSLRWYVAFGYLKLAVLRRSIHLRFVDGHAPVSFARVGELVAPLVRTSLTTLETA